MRARAPFGIGAYAVAASAIAGTGFAIGQIAPGMGVPVVLAASFGWAAWSTASARKWQNENG